MNSTRDHPDEGQEGNHPEIRRQLIGLIRRRKRRSDFTKVRPTRIYDWKILNPETGFPLTEESMWRYIVQILESGAPLKETPLRQPPGEIAWVCRARLARDSTLIYIKLQFVGHNVILRSFHPDDYDD